MLRIYADENIPLVEEKFSRFGSVHLFTGRTLKKKDILEADVLLVRSVTSVNASLLEGTPVKFVGTATAGINHLDIDYLSEKDIFWCSAPGSNARSVAEYALASLLMEDVRLSQTSTVLGLVGFGHVGKEMKSLFSSLVAEIKAFDPFLDQASDPCLCPLIDLRDVDLLSFHTPLTQNVEQATLNWVGKKFFEGFRNQPVVINTSRGEVFKELELRELVDDEKIKSLFLDVFWNEPNPNANMVEMAKIATPHIAGYSYTGKIRGVNLLVKALAKWVKVEIVEELDEGPTLDVEWQGSWEKQVLNAYNPVFDDMILRQGVEAKDKGKQFDLHRKNYPQRLEFPCLTVLNVPEKEKEQLLKLGFKLA